MGTRSDYYIIEKKEVKWLGSCGWDGYPTGIPCELGKINNSVDYIDEIHNLITEHNGYAKNWPWPWEDSKTTDFTYVFKDNSVYVSCYGSKFMLLKEYLKDEDKFMEIDDLEDTDFKDINFSWPDMTKIQKVDLGLGSGVITLSKK